MRKRKSCVGIDLHRNQFTYCVRYEDGEEKIGKEKIENLKWFAGCLGNHASIALEVTGNTWMFCQMLKDQVGRLVVVNQNQFKVISRSVKKTDKNDAKVLAKFLEKDMLPEVKMKDELNAKIASLTQTHEKLVQLQTVLKNKINNIFAANFITLKREEKSSPKGLRQILSYRFNPITAVEIHVMVDQSRALNKSIQELDAAIEDNGSKMDGFENLKSIKGIGAKGAATMLSVIDDIENFRSAKQLAAYIGIVPYVSNTNDTEHHGRITKLGSKIARTTLVQCSLIAKRYNLYLHDFYGSVKRRRCGAKANIALARKFLEIIYRILKNHWIFEDFTRFKLKTA